MSRITTSHDFRATFAPSIAGPARGAGVPVRGAGAAVRGALVEVAERGGFEPPTGCPEPHFQCGAIGL
jgi:hypothetical protein